MSDELQGGRLSHLFSVIAPPLVLQELGGAFTFLPGGILAGGPYTIDDRPAQGTRWFIDYLAVKQFIFTGGGVGTPVSSAKVSVRLGGFPLTKLDLELAEDGSWEGVTNFASGINLIELDPDFTCAFQVTGAAFPYAWGGFQLLLAGSVQPDTLTF